eukprot:11814805-Alexandrium_andersonii.AAC.1
MQNGRLSASDQSDQSEVDDFEEELRERRVGLWLELIRQLPIGSTVGVSRFGFDFVGTLNGFQDTP